jgi:opacity protein-like surface antigen
MKLKAALIAASALVAGAAVADDNGFYVGAGVGGGHVSIPTSKVTNTILDGFDYYGYPLDSLSTNSSNTTIMWSAFVGYRFMKYVAVEAGYLDTGSTSYTLHGSTTVFDTSLDQNVSVPIKANFDWGATGWPVSVLGIWPVNDNWEVFGRVGGYFGDVKGNYRLSLTDPNSGEVFSSKAHDSSSSSEFLYGAGVEGRFLENWAARLEWLSIASLGNNSTGTADWNAFQFALLYRF